MDDIAYIQELIFEALCELKMWLSSYNISFFLRGGSVMGAVKYKGFVPWDDDADIAIDRQDYDRFIAKIPEFNAESRKFVIYSYKWNDSLHCYFPQLFLKESERVVSGLPKNNKLGLLLIDVLPLDGAPDQTFERIAYFLKVYSYRALAGAKTLCSEGDVTAHTLPVTIALHLMKWFHITHFYTQVDIYNRLDRLYKSQVGNGRFKGTITAFHLAREVFPAEVWGDGISAKFEDEYFLIPVMYDYYLKRLYGENYMNEEPSESQKEFKRHVKQA